MLLDAIMLTMGPSNRNNIYEALIGNLNTIENEDGVIIHTRREGLLDLVIGGLLDPKLAVSHLEE